MNGNDKRQHIIKILSAPAVYYLISTVVAVVFTLLYTFMVSLKNPAGSISESQLNELLSRQTMLMTMISAIIAIPIIYFFFFDRRNERFTKSIAYVYVALLGFGCCITFNTLVSVLNLPAYSKTYQEVAKNIYSGGLFIEILSATIVVPIVEELIFRGVIFKRMCSMIKVIPAVILSSVIFGVIHGNLVQFVYATCLGMALCFVYIRCKSIAAPILLHMMANLTSIVISDCEPVSRLVNTPAGFLGVLISAILFLITMPVLIYFCTKTTKSV